MEKLFEEIENLNKLLKESKNYQDYLKVKNRCLKRNDLINLVDEIKLIEKAIVKEKISIEEGEKLIKEKEETLFNDKDFKELIKLQYLIDLDNKKISEIIYSYFNK